MINQESPQLANNVLSILSSMQAIARAVKVVLLYPQNIGWCEEINRFVQSENLHDCWYPTER